MISLAACSSIKSISQPDDKSADGLIYFLPKKDLLVTVIVDDKGLKTVSLGATPAYPDMQKQFVLKYGRNFFGKNTLDVKVKDGLLDTAKSTTVSNATEAFKGLAASAGQIKGTLESVSSVDDNCLAKGTHTFTYRIAEGRKFHSPESRSLRHRCTASHIKRLPKMDKLNSERSTSRKCALTTL